MKREIKFRAKSLTEDKRWLYGSYVTRITSRGGIEHLIVTIDGVEHACDVSTLGQSTNLKDRNGKEIYEGDIVSHIYSEGHEKNQYVVNYYAPEFVLEEDGVTHHFDDFTDRHNSDSFQIIGNIYENPELCK